MIVARAPGKTILFGEHFVVYGAPALAMAINRYVTVKIVELQSDLLEIFSENTGLKGSFKIASLKPVNTEKSVVKTLLPVIRSYEIVSSLAGIKRGARILIKSQVPIAAGLGSSAALAVATISGLSRFFNISVDSRTLNNLAYQVEKVVHGTPSGIDNTVSVYGGYIYYKRDKEGPVINKLNIDIKLNLAIGCTGIMRSTGLMVNKVSKLFSRYPLVSEKILETYTALLKSVLKMLSKGDISAVGELMNINHGLLWSIGVSIKELDDLVNVSLKNGAYGAKLTGAGGGGCMIALADNDTIDNVVRGIKLAGGEAFKASTNSTGVIVEEV